MRNLNDINRADVIWLLLLAGTVATMTVLNALGEVDVPPTWRLGPLSVSPFGPFVVLNLLFAFHLLERWAHVFSLPLAPMIWCGVIVAVAGLLGAHLFTIFFYYPDLPHAWGRWLDLRIGMSSFGGLITGGLAAWITLRRFRVPVLEGLDSLAYAFVGGYVFGRAGCFLIHDHPGTPTEFFLGSVIDGATRHDLGFYEMWLVLIILGIFHLRFGSKRPRPGGAVTLFFLIYAPIRFLLDFLRVEDHRYANLTPGQWVSFAMFGLAVAWLWSHRTGLSRR